MNLLIPDTGLLFWMLVSFGIVLVVLLRWGFPVILRAIEQRRERIEESLEAARQADEHLASVEEQAQELLRKASHEQAALLQQARDQASELLRAAREQADRQTKEQLARAAVGAEELHRKAMQQARDQIARLAVQIASRIVGAHLSVPGEQKRLIERLLHEELKME